MIEECLHGEEVSILAITDGQTIIPLSSARDHKAIYEGNKGPNTGGMGAYSPSHLITNEMQRYIEENILVPIIHAMKRENRPYSGIIYAGIMLTNAGPKVLEFNARFGDPETQALLVRMKSDLASLLLAASNNTLDKAELEWYDSHSVCVVLASKGYPGKYRKGLPISGLQAVKALKNVQVFHAGTANVHGNIVTNGGRVLGITATGKDLKEARTFVYDAIDRLSFEGVYYRKDIGVDAI